MLRREKNNTRTPPAHKQCPHAGDWWLGVDPTPVNSVTSIGFPQLSASSATTLRTSWPFFPSSPQSAAKFSVVSGQNVCVIYRASQNDMPCRVFEVGKEFLVGKWKKRWWHDDEFLKYHQISKCGHINTYIYIIYTKRLKSIYTNILSIIIIIIAYFTKDMYKLYTLHSPTRTEQIMPFREHALAEAPLRKRPFPAV